MSDAIDILPCPKCKSPGKIAHKQGSYGYYCGTYWVKCTGRDCAVTSRRFDDDEYIEGKGTVDRTKEAQAKAIADWNRRA